MTYEEFKKELFRNVSLQENNHNRRVELLERNAVDRGQLFPDNSVGVRGNRGKMVREDYLYVQWDKQNPQTMKRWNIPMLYDRYKEEGWQAILSEITNGFCTTRQWAVANQRKGSGYEKNCRQFILRPLNYRLNREELGDCIYWRFGDIALVLYSQLGNVEKEYVTIKIRRCMTEKWNVPPEKMLTDALFNSFTQMPPRIFQAGDIRFSYDWDDGVFMPGECRMDEVILSREREEGIRGYRLTTTKRQNGAIAIFYPGVQARLAEILKGDYLVGFTSIHEAVIHPVHLKNVNEMKAAIRHINTVFDEQDMLTNSIYRYCEKRGKLLEI